MILILAPELYLPLRNLGAQYHASADGVAVAGRLLGLADAVPPPPDGFGGRRAPPRRWCASSGSRTPTRAVRYR